MEDKRWRRSTLGQNFIRGDQFRAGMKIPAIGDQASIQWALGKKIGDTVDYTDEHGNPFKVRIVGAVANSILQGSLLIDETEFVKRFPGESGYRMFLVDAPPRDKSATFCEYFIDTRLAGQGPGIDADRVPPQRLQRGAKHLP